MQIYLKMFILNNTISFFLERSSLSVEIKGITLPALKIKLDENKTVEENIQEIEKKISSKFFKGSICILDTGNMKISQEDREKIEKVIEKHNSKLLAYQQTSKERNTPQIKEKKTLKIVSKTVRSGQRVEYDGDILIIGDVNPDAYIVASGNIIVMGALRGVVHAGANGDETAVILALKLMPQQLRIANYITRPPDDMEEAAYPEKAYIENGHIIIEKI